MFRKIVVVGVLLMGVVLFGAASADSGGTQIWFEVNKNGRIDTDTSTGDHSERIITELIRSSEELQQLCDEQKVFVYQKGEEGYDEDFFAEKALILYAFSGGTPLTNFQIDAVNVQDETLIINIIQSLPGVGGITVEVYWAFLIEVQQEDVIDVTDIQVETKTIARSGGGCRGCA